ncbi:hypothetical protein FJT64_014027 [Amphibalanus amphitrite]|uniref:Uncharacterized protein n=1 Tax=Amphibalanus amphitrite TaxID=1232801 RepID=A0A6A4VB36_AMPAM|nr:hypothetical protein FJT64_014027 [Amphibalanus amphitrite]
MSSYSYKVTRETSGPRGGSYSTSSYSSPTAYSPPLNKHYDWLCDYDPVHVYYLTHTDMGSHMVLDELDMIRAQNFLDPEYWPYYWPYFAPEQLLQGRSYHSSYMSPSVRTSRYVPPPRTYTYTTYDSSPRTTYAPRSDIGEHVVKRVERVVESTTTNARHGIPSVAHQRLTPVSLPAYSSPLMPYLLMDEDDVVVLPRRRTLARLSDELDDDPVLKRFSGSCHNCCGAVARPVQQVTVVARPSPRLYSVPSYGPFVSGEDELRNWYEDRIHHAQVEASSIAQSHINDLCTPKPRHISVTPMYTPKLYPEPVAPRLAQYTRHRSRAAADPLKPVRRNIELKSRFNSANDAAQNTYKRMGSGHLACLSLLGGPVVSKRTHSRFYNGERVRSEDMAQRLLPSPRDDPSSHRRK